MVRRVVHVLIIVLTLMVGATAAAIIVSQTTWFKDWLRGYIERQANQYLNGQVSIQRLGGDLAPLVPSLSGIALQPAFELKTDGTLDRLTIGANVRSSAGQLTADLVADLAQPVQAAEGTLSAQHVDIGPILKRNQHSDISGDASVNLRMTSPGDLNTLKGIIALNAPHVAAGGFAAEQVMAKAAIDGRRVGLDVRASAYGATASAAGLVILPETTNDARSGQVSFDLSGEARNLNLRRLPRELKIAPAATTLNASYHAAGSVGKASGDTAIRADARFLPSTIAGAGIAGGSVASISVHGRDIAYSADATVSRLDLQRIGQQFELPTLATERYASAINGHVVAAGRGTDLSEMQLTASGALTDSSLLGGRIPQLDFDARVARNAAQVNAQDAFADLDPAVVSGRAAMKGRVGGTLDVDAGMFDLSRGAAVNNVHASGVVHLDPSNIGGLELTRATIDGDYENSAGIIRSVEIVGRDINATAVGTLALNDTGESNLTNREPSEPVEPLRTLINRSPARPPAPWRR